MVEVLVEQRLDEERLEITLQRDLDQRLDQVDAALARDLGDRPVRPMNALSLGPRVWNVSLLLVRMWNDAILSEVLMRGIGLAVVLVGILSLAPLAAEPQTARSIPTIGLFNPAVERLPTVDAFEHSLRELGWIGGQNLRIESRPPVGPEGAAAPAVADLLRLSPVP